jgi:hypothetical protein
MGVGQGLGNTHKRGIAFGQGGVARVCLAHVVSAHHVCSGVGTQKGIAFGHPSH